jgi:hypothetical protein
MQRLTKRLRALAFNFIAYNGIGLGEGQKLIVQMFKISTNESR